MEVARIDGYAASRSAGVPVAQMARIGPRISAAWRASRSRIVPRVQTKMPAFQLARPVATGHFPRRGLGQDVAVAGFGAGRRNAQRHERAAEGKLRGRAKCVAVAGLVGYVGVGRHHDHDFVDGPVNRLRGQSHGRGSVTADRLADQIGSRNGGQLLRHEREMAALGDDVDVPR
jgi:hypothetical protein